jgi:alpha-L-fucosidase
MYRYRLILFLLPLLLDAQPSSEARLQWFRQDKFGMFIHWGPYSHLAGEWNGCRVPAGEQAEWIMNQCRIPAVQYREAAHDFNPAKFDAAAWVRLAHEAGMKYLVLTAKHHDGFAMYRSAVSRYNIVDWTRFGRDPVKELAGRCREQGVRFGVYYSHREDWDDPDAYGNDWDYKEPQKNFERYLERKSKPQVRELLAGYGSLALIWFDRGLYTHQQAREFLDIVRSAQPDCLVNGRVGNYDHELMGDYQSLDDNGMPPGGLDEDWETPQTLNETWGYNRFDERWKTPAEVVRRLVEIVSKGGNYLLNVGPKGDGTIPAETIDILSRVGRWLGRNGESIYGTSACPPALTPWGACTVKGERLYLHVFDWPKDGALRIEGLRNQVVGAHLLSTPAAALAVRKQGGRVVIRVPAQSPDALDAVIALDVKGRPEAEPASVGPADRGALRLDYVTAITKGRAAKRFTPTGGYHIAGWSGPEDVALWHIRAGKPGTYAVRIVYAARPEWKGGRFEARIGGKRLSGAVEPTGDWYNYRSFDVGRIELTGAGQHDTAELHPATALGHPLMQLQFLELIPVKPQPAAEARSRK